MLAQLGFPSLLLNTIAGGKATAVVPYAGSYFGPFFFGQRYFGSFYFGGF